MGVKPPPTLGRWWQPVVEATLRTPRLRCTLCPRRCVLKEGERGFCYVRQNVGGAGVELTSYGRSSGFWVDPVEKKPLHHFLPGSSILSFGTAGCNLGCQFCQNWDISKAQDMHKLAHEATPEMIAEAAVAEGCQSVAFTYNDPVVFAEYVVDTARECHARGVHTVAVTAGYITEEAREEFFRDIDAANVDLKGFSEAFYQRLCKGHLQPVLDTLLYLRHHTKVWLELTTLLIPGENDSDDELAAMTAWIAANLGVDVPLHFTAFHPDYNLRSTPPTPHATLLRAQLLARQAGLRYVYVGNVRGDSRGSSTYCPTCDTLLIQRDWYTLKSYNLRGNQCSQCQAVVPGVFAAPTTTTNTTSSSSSSIRRWRPASLFK